MRNWHVIMIRIILQNWHVIYDMATCVNEGA